MSTHYNIVIYDSVASVVNATLLCGPNCFGFCICNSIVYRFSYSSLAIIQSDTPSCCYNRLPNLKNFSTSEVLLNVSFNLTWPDTGLEKDF